MPRYYVTFTEFEINLDGMCDVERAIVERIFGAYKLCPYTELFTGDKEDPRHPNFIWVEKHWGPLRDEAYAFLRNRGHPFVDDVPRFTSMMIQKKRWRPTRRNPLFVQDIHYDLSFRLAEAFSFYDTEAPKIPVFDRE